MSPGLPPRPPGWLLISALKSITLIVLTTKKVVAIDSYRLTDTIDRKSNPITPFRALNYGTKLQIRRHAHVCPRGYPPWDGH